VDVSCVAEETSIEISYLCVAQGWYSLQVARTENL